MKERMKTRLCIDCLEIEARRWAVIGAPFLVCCLCGAITVERPDGSVATMNKHEASALRARLKAVNHRPELKAVS